MLATLHRPKIDGVQAPVTVEFLRRIGWRVVPTDDGGPEKGCKFYFAKPECGQPLCILFVDGRYFGQVVSDPAWNNPYRLSCQGEVALFMKDPAQLLALWGDQAQRQREPGKILAVPVPPKYLTHSWLVENGYNWDGQRSGYSIRTPTAGVVGFEIRSPTSSTLLVLRPRRMFSGWASNRTVSTVVELNSYIAMLEAVVGGGPPTGFMPESGDAGPASGFLAEPAGNPPVPDKPAATRELSDMGTEALLAQGWAKKTADNDEVWVKFQPEHKLDLQVWTHHNLWRGKIVHTTPGQNFPHEQPTIRSAAQLREFFNNPPLYIGEKWKQFLENGNKDKEDLTPSPPLPPLPDINALCRAAIAYVDNYKRIVELRKLSVSPQEELTRREAAHQKYGAMLSAAVTRENPIKCFYVTGTCLRVALEEANRISTEITEMVHTASAI